jgi:hypothetical protein
MHNRSRNSANIEIYSGYAPKTRKILFTKKYQTKTKNPKYHFYETMSYSNSMLPARSLRDFLELDQRNGQKKLVSVKNAASYRFKNVEESSGVDTLTICPLQLT